MTHSPTKLLQFKESLIRLNESELDFEKVHSQHKELEAITYKNLQTQITDTPSSSSISKSDTKSSSSSKFNPRTNSKQSRLAPTTTQSYVLQRASPAIGLRKSGSNADSIIKSSIRSNSDQSVVVQLENRIKQFHESMESIDTLQSRSNPDKTYFLKSLQKVNARTWKNQKLKTPIVARLEKYLK